MDSLASPSKSQLTFEEIPSQPSSSTKPNPRTPNKMAEREEVVVEDVDEFQERRDRRANASTKIGRRESPIYNGREDPTRFLARYTLACRANNKGVTND